MDSARSALAALAALGSGIVLGLAANPTMRPMPGSDWRERYRANASAPQQPAPQSGVSYYGDGSTAWIFGAIPPRFRERLPPLRIPAWREPPESWTPAPLPDLAKDSFDAEASAAERAAAQAVVASALARSAPPQPLPAADGQPGEPGDWQDTDGPNTNEADGISPPAQEPLPIPAQANRAGA